MTKIIYSCLDLLEHNVFGSLATWQDQKWNYPHLWIEKVNFGAFWKVAIFSKWVEIFQSCSNTSLVHPLWLLWSIYSFWKSIQMICPAQNVSKSAAWKQDWIHPKFLAIILSQVIILNSLFSKVYSQWIGLGGILEKIFQISNHFENIRDLSVLQNLWGTLYKKIQQLFIFCKLDFARFLTELTAETLFVNKLLSFFLKEYVGKFKSR